MPRSEAPTDSPGLLESLARFLVSKDFVSHWRCDELLMVHQEVEGDSSERGKAIYDARTGNCLLWWGKSTGAFLGITRLRHFSVGDSCLLVLIGLVFLALGFYERRRREEKTGTGSQTRDGAEPKAGVTVSDSRRD